MKGKGFRYEDLNIVFSCYDDFCAWYGEWEHIYPPTIEMTIRIINEEKNIIEYGSPLDVFRAHEEESSTRGL